MSFLKIWSEVRRQARKWWWICSSKIGIWYRRTLRRVLPSAASGSSRRRPKPSPAQREHKPQLFYAEQFTTPDAVTLQTVGVVHSAYKERFGTPRQATVHENALGNRPQRTEIHLKDESNLRKALRGLDGFEYVWVITFMHLNNRKWNPLVTPPRGPKIKQGVFATRAPHRPNPIALSALRLLNIDHNTGILTFEGSDLLHGTPVLDIKPYVPYADAFPAARCGWLESIDRMTAPDRLAYWPPPRQCRGEASDSSTPDPSAAAFSTESS
jgi:tRNA-Thr(GGU) m(6)t(6)A37 methyltransferase TsaA